MAFCLGGMYCADLYELKKDDYYDGIIHYNRAKTKHCRKDSAYMEMRVPDIIKPLFKKYRSSHNKGLLFCFHEMYATEDSFCANVNSGIRQISCILWLRDIRRDRPKNIQSTERRLCNRYAPCMVQRQYYLGGRPGVFCCFS